MSSKDANCTEDTIEDVTGFRSSNNERCTEKETPNALRNTVSVVSSNYEKSEIETISEAKRNTSVICRASVVWKIIKYAIFLTCFSFLFQQSMDFCNYYLTYPLTTNIVVRNSKIVKKPAITRRYALSADFECAVSKINFAFHLFQMCRAYCKMIYFRKCLDCDWKQKVYTESMKLCPLSGFSFQMWEIFSHVGGLVGCWLGISVWTAFNFIEDLYKSTLKSGVQVEKQIETVG
ncbi:hypothetical protein CEXT_387541 [Caerostris extrusa]|uniref:Uncharacterized protein n=1 Tax=Caerostris extrusa TaxID=172846 RepID=A0AAV4TW63_CAEEX|nr:hypothetical protein CEXT_387541 [Caerostris extrusa]